MSEEKREKEEKGGFLGDLPTLLLAIGVALLIRTFIVQSFYVPSDSMFPTMLVGDHVFVTKLSFGPRIPFTGVSLPGFREPRRGEVVVFNLARGPGGQIFPPDERPDLRTEAFIKRLVGLPGDVIEVRDGIVYLNGEPSPWTPVGESFTDSGGRVFDVYAEALGECRHRILDDPNLRRPDMLPRTIPEGRYFFMGDNRDNSHDSRFFGSVRLEDLEGPAGLLYWSWDWAGSWLSLLNPLTWWDNLAHRMRWERMGAFLECEP